MLNDFITYLNEQVENNSIYVWGAQGQTGNQITEQWIRSRETSKKNADRAISLWKKKIRAGFGKVLRAFDCSGLGVYWLYNLKRLIKSDTTANGLKGLCTRISRSQLKKGDWVFRTYSSGKAYHIGYVADEQLNVIEAKGRDDGVVKRGLNANGRSYWNAYGRPGLFGAEVEQEPGGWTVSRVLKRTAPLMKGADVLGLKRALVAAGYLHAATKDTFGDDTARAVRSFQQAKGLTVDGKAGKNTVTALGGVWMN